MNSSKGTVTPLASMFSAEEAQRAAKRVEHTVSQKQEELRNLKHFISDNANLINLVSRLPDDLTHEVMVPFGKAAFFPGRLVHTNEFMVLLGEGYFAERTAKQTVEILKRRGKALETQVQSIKANIEDLKAEASFFDSTATEALEGLVEIREDYVEDSSSNKQSESADEKKVTVEDDEYSRIMARLDELEREELATEGAEDDDGDEVEDEDVNEDSDEDEEEEGEGEGENNTDESDQDEQISAIKTDIRIDKSSLEQRKKVEWLSKDEETAADLLSHDYQYRLHITDEPNCTGLTVQSVAEDELSKGKSSSHNVETYPSADRNTMLPEVKEKIGAASISRNEAFTGSILERSPENQEQTASSLQKPSPSTRPSTSGFDSSKAFTGSIVEHTHNLQPPSQGQNATSSQPSKPVSRFKMQRR